MTDNTKGTGTSTPVNLRVPKSMPAEDVIWAFRYGVAHARKYVLGDLSAVKRHNLGAVAAPRNVLLLADRVRRETERRLRERAGDSPLPRLRPRRKARPCGGCRDLGPHTLLPGCEYALSVS